MNNNANILIKRSKRKNISLSILPNRQIQVKAPFNVSKTMILDFVKTKQRWIQKQLSLQKQRSDFEKSFDFENYYYIYGKQYKKDKIIDYKTLALDELPKLIELTKEQIGYHYNKIVIKSSKRLWGSYSSKKVIMLNFKCIILPKDIIQYIIIHELCHSNQMNHSPKFWNLVEKFCPNYKDAKCQLSNFAFLLKKDI